MSKRDVVTRRRPGFYYAPDPSSQIACTIGGNVAENSGGVHCLIEGLPILGISRFPNPKVSDILNHALIVFGAIVLCFRHPTYIRMGER
jgi:hypothetical protein